jgi:hypothetical protein
MPLNARIYALVRKALLTEQWATVLNTRTKPQTGVDSVNAEQGSRKKWITKIRQKT